MNQQQSLVLTLLIVIAIFAAIIRLRSTGFWQALTTKVDKQYQIKVAMPLDKTLTIPFGGPSNV